jgi:pyruvate dehydrogenase E2 component (dihydrolipoamide acetyltransferase)
VSTQEIKVPDIGGAEEVEVIEICVAVGDQIEAEDSIVVLESDKASMEIPAPHGGKVVSIAVKEGDSVSEGMLLLTLETEADASEAAPAAQQAEPKAEEAAPVSKPAPSSGPASTVAANEIVKVPDIGGSEGVEVIELCVAVGDEVAEGDSIVVLESDKASMEVPAPKAGKVLRWIVSEGDQVAEGSELLEIETQGAAAPEHKQEQASNPAPAKSAPSAAPAVVDNEPAVVASEPVKPVGDSVYAGPAVRKLAREFGVTLAQVSGSGPKGRILKEDVQAYVKSALSKKSSSAVTGGAGIPAIPAVDFAKFGEVSSEPLSKIHKVTAANLHRSWLNVPHVTQFDDADITDLEDFRQALKADAERRGVKVTPLPFLLKACANALKENPKFNASLDADGENLIYKHYVHIGMAVDTPAGLVVPVIRDVDKKSIWELAAETAELADKAKNRKLKPEEMQGGCFTISSLGGIGGTGFTPIVNAPEVAILGVSKLAVKPVWDGETFQPRKMLPLSLSYDHRAINGGDAGRFFTYLGELLADIRRLAL